MQIELLDLSHRRHSSPGEDLGHLCDGNLFLASTAASGTRRLGPSQRTVASVLEIPLELGGAGWQRPG